MSRYIQIGRPWEGRGGGAAGILSKRKNKKSTEKLNSQKNTCSIDIVYTQHKGFSKIQCRLTTSNFHILQKSKNHSTKKYMIINIEKKEFTIVRFNLAS